MQTEPVRNAYVDDGWCAISKSKNAMKPDEQAAMDSMIAAAQDWQQERAGQTQQ